MAWARARKPLHSLFSKDYIAQDNVEVDELHVIHLGTSAYMLGSILWCLCYEIMGGEAVDNMHQIWGRITRCYQELKTATQFSSMSLSSFCDPKSRDRSYPKLKGRGAEIKDLVHPLIITLREIRRDGNEEDRWVIEMLEAQLDMQTVLSDTALELFLAVDEATHVRECVDKILMRYTLLANAADARGATAFNLVPKFHFLWHFADKCIYLHPRRGNTMVDEDYVGLVKKVVHSCVWATGPSKVPETVAEQIRWGQLFAAMYNSEYTVA